MDIPGRRFEQGKILYTDWMPRGGDGIIVRGESLAWTASTTMELKIEVFTKESTEAGDGTAVDSGVWVLTLDDSAGIKEMVKISGAANADPGMNDLVRLKITTSSGSPGDYIVARIFPLIVFDKSH